MKVFVRNTFERGDQGADCAREGRLGHAWLSSRV